MSPLQRTERHGSKLVHPAVEPALRRLDAVAHDDREFTAVVKAQPFTGTCGLQQPGAILEKATTEESYKPLWSPGL